MLWVFALVCVVPIVGMALFYGVPTRPALWAVPLFLSTKSPASS